MAQTLSILDGNASLSILRNAIEISTTNTVMYGSNGVPVVNTLTIQKKSIIRRIFKR